jgi:excisionase family DNA binding protein
MATKQAQEPQLEPAKKTSRRTGIPYGSLRDLAYRGEIPVVRVGRAWYFDRSDVDRWIALNKETIPR